MELILWDLYQITAKKTSLTGVMLRGRLRKLCLNSGKNVLVENAMDEHNCVRFAVINGQDIEEITSYLKSLGKDIEVTPVLTALKNPVLSKLNVNNDNRYTL